MENGGWQAFAECANRAYFECECLMAALKEFLSVSDFVSSGSALHREVPQ